MKRFLTTSALGALLAYVVVPGMVFAHATPITYTPAAGVTELSAPSSVTIYFSERIEEAASGIKIYAADGSEVHIGVASIDPSDNRVFSVGMRDAGEGVYTATWQVVSVDDGHFTKGSFSFLVDSTGKAFEGEAEGETQVTYVTKRGEAWVGLLSLVGESLLLGFSLMYLFVIRPVFGGREVLAEAGYWIDRQASRLVYVGALLLAGGTLAGIVRKSLELASLRGESFATASLTYVQSTVGTQAVLKIIASLIFFAIFMMWRKKIFTSPKASWVEFLLLVPLGAIMYLQSKVSHAAASFFHPELAIGVTAMHLFFKELLVGGAVFMAVTASAFLGKGAKNATAHALALYDRLAAVAIILAGTTGAYITWLHLKRFDNLSGTEWGERFLLLCIFGVLVGAFRLLHQFVLGPLLVRSPRVGDIIRVTLFAEVVMGLALLFYSGYIAITTPPFTVERFTYEQVVTDDGLTIAFDVHPYETGEFRIRGLSADGNAVPVSTLVVTAHNAEKGIESNVIQTSRRSENSFVFPMSALSPQGDWEVHVVAVREGSYDANASFALRYPDDVAATRYSDETRRYDTFARDMVVAGILLALTGLVFFVHAHLRVRKLRGLRDDLKSSLSLIPHRLLAAVLSFILLLIVLGLETRVLGSEFKDTCYADGFVWRQAFPARDFEVVGKNAVNGCWVHDGHYHMADFDEYRYHTSEYADYTPR